MMVTSSTIVAMQTEVHLLPADLSALVVLPTYNEADNIAICLGEILDTHPAIEVLVVDDNSPDGTATVVLDIAARLPGRIHLLSREGKEGLGAAYRAGFAWALERGYEIVVQMDADGSHPADQLPALLAAVALGSADVAVGSRYVPGGSTPDWSLRRRLLSRYGNVYARAVLGVAQQDLTGGFRAWSRQALGAARPESSTTPGYGFQIELIMAAHCAGARVVELPITFVDRIYGESKMSSAIAIEGLRKVWRLRGSRQTAQSAAPIAAFA